MARFVVKILCTIRVKINGALSYILAWCWFKEKVPKENYKMHTINSKKKIFNSTKKKEKPDLSYIFLKVDKLSLMYYHLRRISG